MDIIKSTIEFLHCQITSILVWVLRCICGLENIKIEDIIYTIFDKTNDIVNCINAKIRKGYRTVKDYYPFISNACYPKIVYNRIEKASIKGVGPKRIEILSKVLWQIKKRYNL